MQAQPAINIIVFLQIRHVGKSIANVTPTIADNIIVQKLIQAIVLNFIYYLILIHLNPAHNPQYCFISTLGSSITRIYKRAIFSINSPP
jgi:hypothetical protein